MKNSILVVAMFIIFLINPSANGQINQETLDIMEQFQGKLVAHMQSLGEAKHANDFHDKSFILGSTNSCFITREKLSHLYDLLYIFLRLSNDDEKRLVLKIFKTVHKETLIFSKVSILLVDSALSQGLKSQDLVASANQLRKDFREIQCFLETIPIK